MKKIVSKIPLLFLLSLGFFSKAKASAPVNIFGDPVLMLGPESLSMGGAMLTLKSTHDNLLQNPAAGAFSKEYAFDGTFSTAARTLSASLFDTKTSEYGAGISYLRRETESADATNRPLMAGTLVNKYQVIGLSVFGKITDEFAIGINGRYSMRDGTGVANLDDKSFNGDVGLVYKINDKFSVGGLYKNILGDSKNLELRSISGGVSYVAVPELTLSALLEKYSRTGDETFNIPDDKKLVWSLGAQYLYEGSFSIRAGYREAAPWKSTWAMGGVGYQKDMLNINYAFATVIKSEGEKFTTHTFQLGLKF